MYCEEISSGEGVYHEKKDHPRRGQAALKGDQKSRVVSLWECLPIRKVQYKLPERFPLERAYCMLGFTSNFC